MCASSESTTLYRSTGRCDQRTVLVVDDDPKLTAVTSAYLGRLDDVAVEARADPEAALARLDETVDCVVSDYEMPEMDGLDVLATVRRDHPGMPVILFSGTDEAGVAERARDHVCAPVVAVETDLRDETADSTLLLICAHTVIVRPAAVSL